MQKCESIQRNKSFLYVMNMRSMNDGMLSGKSGSFKICKQIYHHTLTQMHQFLRLLTEDMEIIYICIKN